MKTRANMYSNGLIHPLTLFISIWMLSFLLYAMHLSGLLVFNTSEVGRLVWWIIAPFVAANLLFSIFYRMSPKSSASINSKDISDEDYLKKVEHRLDWWFKCWIALTIVEMVFSGGVPIMWLILGSSREYVDYGLPVIHIFLGSLLSVLALAKLGLYLLRGDRRRLLIPIFQILWGVVIISRGLMIVALLQAVVLWLCLKGATIKMLFRTTVIILVAILLFGYVGDARSGGISSFRDLAEPSENYPDWLPSGVLWLYVYATSPIGNLVNTSFKSIPSYDPLFPSTTYYLFPTPIRNLIYGKESSIKQEGDVLNESLNVSTAYVGPFKDYGYIGIACFSLLIGILSAYFWEKRRRFRDQILYSIIAQCLVFSIFWNFLFYNPFLGQFFWIYFLFSHKRFRIFPRMNGLPAPGVVHEQILSLSPNPHRESI